MARSYWVVSPNIRNNEKTVGAWRQASVLGHAAFMGYGPYADDYKKTGAKFAGTLDSKESQIKPGDLILIARRHNHRPQIVGFGVVDGSYKRSIEGLKTPESFGSLRRLSPFVPLSGTRTEFRSSTCFARPVPCAESIQPSAVTKRYANGWKINSSNLSNLSRSRRPRLLTSIRLEAISLITKFVQKVRLSSQKIKKLF